MKPACWPLALLKPSSQRMWRTVVSSLTCMVSWPALSSPISIWQVSPKLACFLWGTQDYKWSQTIKATSHCCAKNNPPCCCFSCSSLLVFVFSHPAASPFLLGRALWAASRFTAAMSPELIQQFLQATVSGLHDSQPPSVRISAVRAIWGWASCVFNCVAKPKLRHLMLFLWRNTMSMNNFISKPEVSVQAVIWEAV